MSKRFWMGVVYVAVIGALSNVVALLIRRDKLQEKSFPFRSYAWEKNGKVYDHLAIRKWKNKVPDVSRVLKLLLPKKVASGTRSEDLKKLIKETCVAEIIHCGLIVCSIVVLWIAPGKEGLLLYSLCLIGNLPFIMIQRYNRPQLILAAERLARREERLRQCES